MSRTITIPVSSLLSIRQAIQELEEYGLPEVSHLTGDVAIEQSDDGEWVYIEDVANGSNTIEMSAEAFQEAAISFLKARGVLMSGTIGCFHCIKWATALGPHSPAVDNEVRCMHCNFRTVNVLRFVEQREKS